MQKKRLLERLGLIKSIEVSKAEQAVENESLDCHDEPIVSSRNDDVGVQEFIIPAPADDAEERISFVINSKDMTIQDTILDLDKIYSKFGNKARGAGTIYIVDSFAKALPEGLSEDSRQQLVQKVMQASNSTIEDLVQDGLDKIDYLKSYIKQEKRMLTTREKYVNLEIEKIQKIIDFIEK